MKRYFLEYISDKPTCKSDNHIAAWNHITQRRDRFLHTGYNGNSMKTMKGYIAKIKREQAEYNPRDFRIYDYNAPDEADGHVGQIYHEA